MVQLLNFCKSIQLPVVICYNKAKSREVTRRRVKLLVYLAMIEEPAQQDKFEKLYQKYRYLMLHIAKQVFTEKGKRV